MNFAIKDINGMPGVADGLFGSVVFSSDEEWPDGGVSHHLTVKVRVKVSADATTRDMHEALYQKAVEQLGLALRETEGKTAQQLFSAGPGTF